MKSLILTILLFSIPSMAYEEGPVSFDTVYYMLVDSHYCKSCHSSKYGNKQAGLDMEYEKAYDNLVGYPSMQSNLLRVDPGNPEGSYLLQKLKGVAEKGGRMPMGGPYLSDEELELVEEWILQGAGRD